MQKLLQGAALTVTLFAMPGHAQTEPSQASVCPAFGEIAETIMQNRQGGTSLSSMMGVVDSIAEGQNSDVKTFLRGLIMDAYAVPRFQALANQQRATEDFRNAVERDCYEAPRPGAEHTTQRRDDVSEAMDREVVNDVRRAAEVMNNILVRATEAGIEVEIDVLHIYTLAGPEHGQPVLDVECKKVLR